MPTRVLTECYVGHSQQQAIRELKRDCFRAKLGSLDIKIPDEWWQGPGRVRLK
jgi:hypothetical protein